MDFSKKKITGQKQYDDLYFDGSRCLEIWITNIKLLNLKQKPILFIVELHCYEGFSMIKFYPKSLKNSGELKFKLRGKEFNSGFNVSQIRKILNFCGKAMHFYLDTHPNNLIGFVGQTDDSDNSIQKRRFNSQRFSIYEVFINTYFKFPKYIILDNERLNDLNVKLITKIDETKTNDENLSIHQKENYKLFIENLKSREQSALIQLMTLETQKKYSSN